MQQIVRNFPSTITSYGEYYPRVPKDLRANLEYRKKVLTRAAKDKNFAEQLWIACARDILFWINTFCWIFEPRGAKVLPFITYPYQDEIILEMLNHVNKGDLIFEKSRDMGLSWCMVVMTQWLWLFHDNQTVGVISEKEDLVDAKDDPKTMFTKFDHAIDYMPAWMVPVGYGRNNGTRSFGHAYNPETRSSFDGTSSTPTSGTADRRNLYCLDEFSKIRYQQQILTSTQAVTNSRFFNFTPNGMGNAAHKIATDKKTRKITIHWSIHPVMSKGLYRSDGTSITILDHEWHAKNPGYVCRPKAGQWKGLRSPLYDAWCDAAGATDRSIAQERDISYAGSGYCVFDQEALERASNTCTMAWSVGSLKHDKQTAQIDGFVGRYDGELSLWMFLTNGEPYHGEEYVIGADIAVGTGTDSYAGASNSVLSVLNRKTGEQVAEMVTSYMDPRELAVYAVALCNWFSGPDGEGAYLIWEANGMCGESFGKYVLELGYRNIYWRKDEMRTMATPQDKPGWYSTIGKDGTKALAILGLNEAMKSGRCTLRSEELVAECSHYVHSGDSAVFDESQHTDDPTQARHNHGDRVIAVMLAVFKLDKQNRVKDPANASKELIDVPRNCMAAIMERTTKARAGTGNQLSW